ncbi:P-loop containing nucleoside triphosphate hydrolase protein [Xylaria sp. CBS 124048]|nr:P-loop containing nucleoside triphosphate hydrolase protein [Xylaria sp. CBS 124048]
MTLQRGGMAGGRPSWNPLAATTSSGSSNPDNRSQRTKKIFDMILRGHRKLDRYQSARDFLESIVAQEDKTSCLEKIAASKPGRDALHEALTFTDVPSFMNTIVSDLLCFLDDPRLKRLCDGEPLAQVLWVIVDPPLFWNNLVRSVKNGVLEAKTLEGFTWLLLQLIMFPSTQSSPFREAAESLLSQSDFPLASLSPKAERYMRQVKAIVQPSSDAGSISASLDGPSPGGRHDNDFVNYRDIAILPTQAELISTERPFCLHAASVANADRASRCQIHLENQFRLLREDMIGEMHEEFRKIINGRQKRGFRNIRIQNLSFNGFDVSAMTNGRPCTLVFHSDSDFVRANLTIKGGNGTADRKKALERTPAFLRNQSFGCLFQDRNFLGFTSIDRNEDGLALKPPQLQLVITSSDSFQKVMNALRQSNVDFLQLSTPVFAYEPILERLQRKANIELADDILGLSDTPEQSPLVPQEIVDSLRRMRTRSSSLESLLGLAKSVSLDPSQIEALIHGSSYKVSLIQGPPGTGKSLVGAILTTILLRNTDETILVLSFTNHALDQFIEDLMDIGIDSNVIVRLGSKSTIRTKPLQLSAQVGGSRGTKVRYELIDSHRSTMTRLFGEIDECAKDIFKNRISPEQVLDHLQCSQADGYFFDAFLVPEATEGETLVGSKGKKIQPSHLFQQWERGRKADKFAPKESNGDLKKVWAMPKPERIAKIRQWEEEIRQEKLGELKRLSEEYNKCQRQFQRLRQAKTEHILQSKRIIACTTTAASMYAPEIQSAAPGIVIVEEAGEILESHILAAMGPSTKHLVQIGDHKQLRPKAKNYKLTVEAGHGYDLNRSLFERLIRQGRPSVTLLNQHRMRPEISALIKHNYPALQDAQSTLNRPHLRGVQDDLVFINHGKLEEKHTALFEKLDPTTKTSKQNVFEVEMILKIVRYLAQQQYKTENITVLTPYLGQLSLLRDMLSQDHDPILNDIDSHDLVDAGLLPAASADVNKKSIKLSTIDNYQGEESDIVIVSLTRSNEDGEIGFMAAPERLNVLVSRARDALIMIGNASTFMNASKGREEWIRLFERLKSQGQIFDGLPVRCEKHPSRMAVLHSPDQFDLHCPDGGCAEPCSEFLSCGKHICPKRCHIQVDHSNIPCSEMMTSACTNGHKLVWRCSDKKPPPCQTCRLEKEEKERKARRDLELELERQEKQRAYAKKLAAMKDAIAKQHQAMNDKREELLRQQTLRQHEAELSRLVEETKQVFASRASPLPRKADNSKPSSKKKAPHDGQGGQQQPSSGQGQKDQPKPDGQKVEPGENEPESEDGSDVSDAEEPIPVRQPSSAEKDWQMQKALELASNEALDSLMDMIGLESVKQEFLTIKARVDTVVRQGVDLKGDRFGTSLLGNPGTGKTTVARLYGKFLSSMGVIPGSHFEETTGSRLAHDGIQGAQAVIDTLLKKGGGVFFLDEAYQIVSSSSLGGSQVLDFLLAEIENQTGKIVFVFAGYRKQMEAFFAHNPGIPSRIPIRLDFQDYEDGELLRIMQHALHKKYSGRMKVQGGEGGLYMRIASRRIGRGRGREGFGNAREVHNVLSILLRRQADRLHQSRRRGACPDDFLLQKIDIIGPEPSRAISVNGDWQALQKMIGLKSVKQSVQVLVDRLQTNYERELNEQPPINCSLNRVFVGNPGTGKTTVAKLYGGILAALGLLSNGEVVVKNPADFVGGALGQSEKNTKAILEATKGKVLIIDEAYMLGSGLSETGGASDPYKTAVVDTIVAEVQSTSVEDRCVLLLGYQGLMEDMFQKVNPGLARRFPMSSAFVFEDYDDAELRSILDLKLKKQGFRASEVAKKACISLLGRARNRPNFGNAGEVDIIIDRAKERQQKRLSELSGPKEMDIFEPQDIDPDFNRLDQAETNVKLLFKGVVGCENVIQQLEEYQQRVRSMKALDMSDAEVRSNIPFTLLFRGPPGTGKTSTAKKMGKVYYDLGLLAEAKVVECSATDLIGQYVGQTGPKVQKKFDEGLGRVLFIDEAYRLAEDHFAKEAMDEMVDCLTKERYMNKLLVILAGYDEDINRLMSQNPGLTSRFPETIAFSHMPPRYCRDLLLQVLSARLDISQLEASLTLDGKLLDLFSVLARTTSWGNARDVQTLGKSIFAQTIKSTTRVVDEDVVVDVINSMIKERTERETVVKSDAWKNLTPPMRTRLESEQPPNPRISTTTTVETVKDDEKSKKAPPGEDTKPPETKRGPCRDAGVSDEVWEQLQRDTKAAEQRQRELAASRQKAAELKRKLQAEEEELKRQRDDAARREVLRKLEIIRKEHERAERERCEREERMRKEMEAKAKLKSMGLCCMGYEWIPQEGGYRCAGGSHYITNGKLGF